MWIEQTIFQLGHTQAKLRNANQGRVKPCRRLPDSALSVSTRKNAGHSAAGNECVQAIVEQRVGIHNAREEDSRILAVGAHRTHSGLRQGDGCPTAWRINQQSRAAGVAECGCVAHQTRINIVAGLIRRYAQDVKNVSIVERIQTLLGGFESWAVKVVLNQQTTI